MHRRRTTQAKTATAPGTGERVSHWLAALATLLLAMAYAQSVDARPQALADSNLARSQHANIEANLRQYGLSQESYDAALRVYAAGDLQGASLLWQELADEGHAEAQFALGIMYDKGHGVTPDVERAVELYRQAAYQGHATASYNLGVAYARGAGVAANYRKAIRWWRLAAARGNTHAQYNMGLLYMSGNGVEKNPHEAVRWWFKAATDGNDPQAKFQLGVLYATGDGVAPDMAEAMRWLQRAARDGFDQANDLLKAIEKLVYVSEP